MSIRHGLLAILADEPAHGYGLKTRFEDSTAHAWPLNVGQVYQTLARLERDGLVAQESRSDRQVWKITPRGRRALGEWYATPVLDESPPRDGLAAKVLLAAATEADAADVDRILDRQRAATMERLQELTRHKRAADPGAELAWSLMLDAQILRLQAELDWIERCDAQLRLRRAR